MGSSNLLAQYLHFGEKSDLYWFPHLLDHPMSLEYKVKKAVTVGKGSLVLRDRGINRHEISQASTALWHIMSLAQLWVLWGNGKSIQFGVQRQKAT